MHANGRWPVDCCQLPVACSVAMAFKSLRPGDGSSKCRAGAGSGINVPPRSCGTVAYFRYLCSAKRAATLPAASPNR